MIGFLTAAIRRFLPSPQDGPVSEAVVCGQRLERLSVLACIAVPSFMAMFAWYGMWPLALAMAASGVFLIGTPFLHRMTGSILLGRESFLIALFAFKCYEVVYFGTIMSPGSMWFVAIPVIAVMVGSVASGVAWIVVTLASVLGFGLLYDGTNVQDHLTPAQMQVAYGFSLTYLILCLSIFVLLVDYERRLALLGLALANETVRKLVISDPLTGLFNRRHIDALIALDDAKSPEARAIEAVMMIDIDRFKSINDTYGHLVGDAVIKAVADAIAAEAGSDNPVGRFGGEEFVCLVQTPCQWRAGSKQQSLADAIRARVSRIVLAGLREGPRITVSIGFAECGMFGSTQATLREADFALYAAKEAGRDRALEARPMGMRSAAAF